MSRIPSILFTLILGTVVAAAAHAAAIDGRWSAEFETGIGRQKYIYTFVADGEKLSGEAEWERMGDHGRTNLTEGRIVGNEVSFVETMGTSDMQLRITYSGTLSGDELSLTREVGDIATEQLVARRIPVQLAPDPDRSTTAP